MRIIRRRNPCDGYRRILPELEARTGKTVNHKRLRRLLSDHDLALPREVPKTKPSPTRKILEEASGKLNLIKGRDFDPVEAFSTDFTEVRYGGGNYKAYLMAVVDLESKYVPGWAVGPSANRELALRCRERVREKMADPDIPLEEQIVHHDPRQRVYQQLAISHRQSGSRRSCWRMVRGSTALRTEQRIPPGLNHFGDG